MTYFKILRNGVTEYHHTAKKLGKSVWVNKDTDNVSLVKPAKKVLKNFTEHVVKAYVRPTEHALNNSKIVL